MLVRKAVLSALLCAGLGFASGANAASVSYWLDQSNALADGVNYLRVTIDDEGMAGFVNFTVEIQPALGSLAGTNFGIQEFGYNIMTPPGVLPPDSSTSPGSWILPTGWSANAAPPTNAEDGFGQFDAAVTSSGSNRLTTLGFSLLSNNSLADFLELSSGNAGQGNVYFAAHVAGFDTGTGTTSAYFGGLTAVPLPAAFLLFGSGLLGLAGFYRRK